MKRIRNESGVTLIVVLMVMVILLSVVGAGLLFSGVNTRMTTNYQTGTRAFYAADAGVNAAMAQLTLDTAAATVPVSRNLGGGVAYRSGRRNDSVPQPLQFLRIRTQAGYSLPSGSGSNSAGYAFHEYQLNVTGTYTAGDGTELAGREVEAVASYGPVPK